MNTVSNGRLSAWWLRVSQAWFDRRMRKFRRDPTVSLAEWEELQRDYKKTFGFEFKQ